MRKPLFTALILIATAASLFGQGDIINTLGTGGTFSVKDGSTTFLTLNQSDGNVSLSNILTLPVTTSSSLGVIFKGADRFMHDFKASGTNGFNTFVGANSGNFTMSGSATDASYTTAVGHSALTSLTTGRDNSAFGTFSLYFNLSGSSNSAFGTSSLYSNTGGGANSAFGTSALYNGTGSYNSAFGYYTLRNSTGNNNSGFGAQSLYKTTGDFNSAIGLNAGFDLTSGSNNTLIGYDAQPSSATVSNEITLGNSSIATLRCQVTTITALSDARDKKNITDLPLGVDFLMNVKPRLFNWDRRDWYQDGKSDGSKMKEEPTAGFIAQELDEAQTNAEADWLNLVLKSNPEKLEATPGNLLPIMVKAIQELKIENEKLLARITRLEQTSSSKDTKLTAN